MHAMVRYSGAFRRGTGRMVRRRFLRRQTGRCGSLFWKWQGVLFRDGCEENFYLDFFRETAAKAGASVFPDLPEGVQISVRKKREKRYLFLLNLSRKRQTLTLGQGYPSVLSERRVGPKLDMEPYAEEIVELA
nr:Beta-galactosidase C-terminal domain [Paenibacillus andongensis]